MKFQRKRSPAAFVKFDLESQSAVRNKFGRCIPIGTGGSMFVLLYHGNPLNPILVSLKRCICKQCRPRSDAAERGLH